jgi:hypothetical protein
MIEVRQDVRRSAFQRSALFALLDHRGIAALTTLGDQLRPIRLPGGTIRYAAITWC